MELRALHSGHDNLVSVVIDQSQSHRQRPREAKAMRHWSVIYAVFPFCRLSGTSSVWTAAAKIGQVMSASSC